MQRIGCNAAVLKSDDNNIWDDEERRRISNELDGTAHANLPRHQFE